MSLWPSGIGLLLGTEQVVSSIPGSVGYIWTVFIACLRLHWVHFGVQTDVHMARHK